MIANISNLTNPIALSSQALGTIQKSVDQRLGENTGRLDNAAKSYGEVQKQLTHLQDEVRRVHEVGKDISSLHEILRAPKVRGVMGEIWLEKLAWPNASAKPLCMPVRLQKRRKSGCHHPAPGSYHLG